MNYFVKRGEERFGPYTLADLQQYVQTGNISPNDLAQSEGMADWVPVSRILGTVPAPPPVSSGYGAAAAPAPAHVPLPPNLHWGLLFLLEFITFGIINFIWTLVQANWARKLDPKSQALVLVAMYPAGIIAGALLGSSTGLGGLLTLAGMIAYVIGIFKIRSAMEQYYNSTGKIGLRLSGVMTFFFSTIYFQYHINQIARRQQSGQMA